MQRFLEKNSESYLSGAQYLLGSILGPLLFAPYINEPPSVVQYSLLDLYADDAEMHGRHSELGWWRRACIAIWFG